MCKSSSIIQDKQFDESKSSKSTVVSWLRYKDDFWLKLSTAFGFFLITDKLYLRYAKNFKDKRFYAKNLSSAYDGKLHFLNFIG